MGAGICAVKILLGEDGQFLPPPHPPSTHFHQSQSQSQSYDQDDATTRCQKPLNASIRSPTSGNGKSIRSRLPLSLQVAHFIPATFPLVPEIKPEHLIICKQSWQKIVSQRQRLEEYGTDIHGITLFYNEFYDRLDKVDGKHLFEEVLMKHAVGYNRIAAKGAILIRIVDFLIKLDGDTALSRGKLRHLGVLHKQKGVRPWQYAVFLEIFVHTLASRLGNEATAEVMEAWVQILAYSLQGLLPTAIDGLVQDSEAYAVSQCDAVGNTRRQTVRVVEENSSGEAVVTSRTSIEQPPSTSTTNTTPHVPPPTPLQQDCDQKKDKHEEEEPSIQSGEIPSSTTSSVIGAGEGTPLVVTDV
eukprot:gene9697-10724_t